MIQQKKSDPFQSIPLVSILIPAYNRPHLLELALRSALNQTYSHTEIIICDDSTHDGVQTMLAPYLSKHSRIRYFRNEKNLREDNYQRCFELASGDYINFLNDDDLFHPEKIEKMVRWLMSRPDVTLVTSYRKSIDEKGDPLPDTASTARISETDAIINGRILGNFCLRNCMNVIGEPTTVMFRKNDMSEKFNHFQGRKYICINDIASWLHLLAKGNAVYITEPLSCFRQHPGQGQNDPGMVVPALNQWFHLIQDARKTGYLQHEKEYKTALIHQLRQSTYLLQLAVDTDREELLISLNVESVIAQCMQTIVHPLHPPYCCPFCNQSFEKFIPWPDQLDFLGVTYEMWNKETAICPICFSLDRERLFRVYIEKETQLLNRPHKLLHVAPEPNLRGWLRQFPHIGCTFGQLETTDDEIEQMDITSISYSDDSFDAIICSHVLEHIPDDMLAMQELYRVLKPGGWGILQVPIALNLEQTLEDETVTTPEARRAVFGQSDHVRLYAKDYADRLKAAGFTVALYNMASVYGAEQTEKYGLSKSDNLYVVTKPG
ncbi:glycosyltransferase [Paenibacillus sp. sptzw28]|uniref:glycosyltransferase n=1 Tax=Paenibacillus sp. sptzw28 TaxID=715179 RepID=UPI001C6E9B49|nr:glycosyltransferase [Paenibacillus sp. sptzw28]QYR19856.1 glycosyltransferase [Paenibacillus sp. sptzw28]